MSKIEVNAIEPQCGTTLTVGAAGTTVTVPSNVVKSNALQASDAGNIISQSGTAITLGASGDSINLASGATQSGFGRTGTVDWDTTAKTATFSAVSGNGYFCNTTAGAFTVNLPAGSAGAIVSLADYAATWQTNNVTVTPNGTEKIGSVNASVSLNTEGQSVTFVYVDSTQGWLNTMDSTSNVRGSPFIAATGGTETTCGDYKIHTFTGPGTFSVSSISSTPAENTVGYLVVAGGGGGSTFTGSGGGGAGGFREGRNVPIDNFTASPLVANAPTNAVTLTAAAFPITVGSGGPGSSCSGVQGGTGNVSTFSSITSAGGGGGGKYVSDTPGQAGSQGSSGGSGGGNMFSGPATGGVGNTPPVSPSQGNNGGSGSQNVGSGDNAGGGGGGAGATGTNGTPNNAGPGGNGVATSITGSSVTRGGGGGGGAHAGSVGSGGSGGGGAGTGYPSGTPGGSGTINTGSGGGGSGSGLGGNAGSGIVIIRYKFQ